MMISPLKKICIHFTKILLGGFICVVLGSCFHCPPLPLPLSKTELLSGESLALSIQMEGQMIGGDGCNGFWYVNHILYGNEQIGTIDECGVYTSPQTEHDLEVILSASLYLMGLDSNEDQKLDCDTQDCIHCLDCCPIAQGTITIKSNTP